MSPDCLNNEGTTMSTTIRTMMVVLLATAWCATAAEPALDAQTRRDAEAALARGVAWLQAQQSADGRIGTNRQITVTALAYQAIRDAGAPNPGALDKTQKCLEDFLATAPASKASFNADICRYVLHLPTPAGQAKATTPASQNREASAQAREFELREIASQKQRADLVKQGQDPDKIAAEQLAHIVVPSSSSAPTGSAVTAVQPALRRTERGYGSLTHVDMRRLLHEDIKSNDPRVDAAMDWAERGLSLDENPGKGTAGLYCFLHAVAKCLNASGEEDIVPMKGGTPIHWREQFIRKLIALQQVDKDGKTGYWVNDNRRYRENDPVLVTVYAMLSLEHALGKK
jgi:hypothetical protein